LVFALLIAAVLSQAPSQAQIDECSVMSSACMADAYCGARNTYVAGALSANIDVWTAAGLWTGPVPTADLGGSTGFVSPNFAIMDSVFHSSIACTWFDMVNYQVDMGFLFQNAAACWGNIYNYSSTFDATTGTVVSPFCAGCHQLAVACGASLECSTASALSNQCAINDGCPQTAIEDPLFGGYQLDMFSFTQDDWCTAGMCYSETGRNAQAQATAGCFMDMVTKALGQEDPSGYCYDKVIDEIETAVMKILIISNVATFAGVAMIFGAVWFFCCRNRNKE